MNFFEKLISSRVGDNRRFFEIAVINFEDSRYLVMIGAFGSIVVPISDINAIHQYYEPHSQRYGSGGTYYEGNTQGILLETDNGMINLVGRGLKIQKYYEFAERLFTGNSVGKYKRNVWTPPPFVFVPFMIIPFVNIAWQKSWNKRFVKGVKISIENFHILATILKENGTQIPLNYMQV